VYRVGNPPDNAPSAHPSNRLRASRPPRAFFSRRAHSTVGPPSFVSQAPRGTGRPSSRGSQNASSHGRTVPRALQIPLADGLPVPPLEPFAPPARFDPSRTISKTFSRRFDRSRRQFFPRAARSDRPRESTNSSRMTVQPSANWKTIKREHGRTVPKTFFEPPEGVTPLSTSEKLNAENASGLRVLRVRRRARCAPRASCMRASGMEALRYDDQRSTVSATQTRRSRPSHSRAAIRRTLRRARLRHPQLRQS